MSDSKGDEPGEHDPVEIEWQFDALDLRPVERWLATLPTLAVETGDGGTVTALARTPRRLVDSYLDTDDWRIARAGFVVRTRRRGRHDEVTLKDTRPAEGSGLRQRLEVTEVLPASGLAALGPDGPVGRRLRAIVGTRRLHEVLQVRTRRRPFALRVGGVDAAEVALDDTMIVVGNGQRPMQLRRVEVEVHPEWLDALEPIVDQLRAVVRAPTGAPLEVRGGAARPRRGDPRHARTSGPPTSRPRPPWVSSPSPCCGASSPWCATRSPARASERIPRSCTTCGWRPGACAPRSRLFESVLPVRAQVFREELGWMGRLLGAVRDLDVQQQGLAEMAAQGAGVIAGIDTTDHDPLADLAALLERERQAARAELLSGLDSVRWDRLVKGLTAMAQQGPARRSLATRVPAEIGMPELVLARHDKVTKAARRRQAVRRGVGLPPRAHPVQAAALRARVQRADVYGGRTSRFVRELTVLQDELGEMQDAEVASLQLAALATGETHLPAATIFVMGGVAERHRRDVNRFLKRLPAELPAPAGRRGASCATSWSAAGPRPRPNGRLPAPRCAPCPRPAPGAEPAPAPPPAADARPGTSRRGSGADGAGAAAPVRPGGMTRVVAHDDGGAR